MFQIVLKQLREEAKLSQAKLAEKLSVSQSTVGMWESGKNKPEYETLLKIADLFHVSIDYLTGIETNQVLFPKKGVKIPVLGTIPAGIPIEAIENIIDWEEVPEDLSKSGKEYFALQVKGDSMYPEYLPGDIVIVQKTPTCESGDDCVVYVNGYDATLKRVLKNEDGSISIRPLNVNYPPQTFSVAEIEKLPVVIGGVVVELRRKKK